MVRSAANARRPSSVRANSNAARSKLCLLPIALIALRRQLAAGEESPDRHGGERQRDQHIVAGKREAKEPPRRLVAAHDIDRLQLLEQVAAAAEVGFAAAG